MNQLLDYLHSITVISIIIDYVVRFVSGYFPYGYGHLAVDGLAVVGGIWTAMHLMKLFIYGMAIISLIGITVFAVQTWKVI